MEVSIVMIAATACLLLQSAAGEGQCSAASAEADELLGNSGCPCIFAGWEYDDEFFAFEAESGFQHTPASNPQITWFNQTLYPDGLGAFTDGVERPYGYLCGTHDSGTAPYCSNMTDPAQRDSWCGDKWCYIDAANCDVAHSPSSYFPDDLVHYSYAACGATNQYSGAADEMWETETRREKLKEQIVRTFVEDITTVPTQDAIVELLQELGQADIRDYDQLRSAMYFQAKHMLRNAGAGAPFSSLHIADSRGMWYKLFSNLNVGIRMPDPSTADMFPEQLWSPFSPFSPTIAQKAKAAGRLVIDGQYSDVCTDQDTLCNWPSWICDADDASACDRSTCCVSDQLYLQVHPSSDDESQPGELYTLRQDDPRVSAWYENAATQYALGRQTLSWSEIAPAVDDNSAGLTVTAAIVIPDESVSDGTADTSGTCVGGWYAGADFSQSAEVLDVVVDGTSIPITLSTDLSTADAAVDALNDGLGAHATASLDQSGAIRITSASTGSGSKVSVVGAAAEQMSFGSSTTTAGQDASAGTVMVERVPHRAAGNWEGLFDFAESPEEMVITVDGINVTVILNSNYDNPADLASAINSALGALGHADLNADGKRLSVTSSTTGPESSVQIVPGGSDRVQKMLCPVIKATVAVDMFLDAISEMLSTTFADDIVYVVDRNTGLLVAESAGEGVLNDDGDQKCAVNAETAGISVSARNLQNLADEWGTVSQKLDPTHFFDSRVYQQDQTQDGWGINWVIVVVQEVHCPIGQALTQLGAEVQCKACPEGMISGAGLACTGCPVGRVANTEQSECDLCPVGMYHDTLGEGCKVCSEALMTPNEDQNACVCPPGLYETARFDVQCFMKDFDPVFMEVHSTVCTECPSCADCFSDPNGIPLPKDGWHAFDETNSTSMMHLFQCPKEASCIGASVPEDAGECAEHHDGVLCNSCSEGYGMSVTEDCKPCEEAASSGRVALVLSIFIVGVVVLWTLAQKFWTGYSSQHLLRCMFQPGKIVVSYCQIVGQLGDVLNFEYPPLFGGVVDAIRPVIEVWSLLFRALGSSDCLGFRGFSAMWNLRVWVLPLVLCGFVVLIYLYNRVRQPEKAAREFPGHLFLAVFFCYPTVCTVAFATYICRQLTDETSVLESDDTVLCEDASHRTLQVLSGIITVLFSLGIPLTLLVVLIKKARAYSTSASERAEDAALRLAKELDLELINAKAVVRDLSEGFGSFYFLTQAFLPEYLYCKELAQRNITPGGTNTDKSPVFLKFIVVLSFVLFLMLMLRLRGCLGCLVWVNGSMLATGIQCSVGEACDMLRKLCLVGLVLLAGRGSTGQIAAALVLSFMFFAVHMKTWPYKIEVDNIFRAATEIHIFIVICVFMILKTDLENEVMQEGFYDNFLLLSYIVLLPSSFVCTVLHKLKFVTKSLKERDAGTISTNRATLRRAYDIHQMGLASNQELDLLRRFIDGWNIRKKTAIFLSHFKNEAAAEARVLKTELQRVLQLGTGDVFLDADNLSDLRKLLDSVADSDAVFLLYTKHVLSRPWCIAELHAAVQNDVPIIVVKIENAFKLDGGIQEICEILDDLPGFLNKANPTAMETLKELGLDAASVGSMIKGAVQNCEVVSFNPHLSSTIMDAQVLQMADTLVDRVCPENRPLLPDANDKKAEPWPVTKKHALYIIHEDKAALVKQAATKAKEWLLTNTDLSFPQIIVHSTSDESAIEEDYNSIINDVDCVLLLQSSNILFEPRALALAYAATTNGIPVVLSNLVTSMDEHQKTVYNFEAAQEVFGGDLSQRPEFEGTSKEVATIERTTGVTLKTIGETLGNVLPNIISKPLTLEKSNDLEPEMQEIQRMLRSQSNNVHQALRDTLKKVRTQRTKNSELQSESLLPHLNAP